MAAIALIDQVVEAKTLRAGDVENSAVAGQGLQIRYGDLGDPAVMLEEQCPEGKQWTFRVYVTIEETDA